MKNKTEYLVWAMSRISKSETSCPYCSSTETQLVKRKYIVTALRRCEDCNLQFRVPKSDIDNTIEFYQNSYTDYTKGFSSLLPAVDNLEKMKHEGFKNTSKDFTTYLNVLEAIGVQKGQTILDWGCSWGYGSWQFAQAGYKVYSSEISKPRAKYAEQFLNCELVDGADGLPETVDVFFSAHVIEHLPDPKLIWNEASKALKPGGVAVIFCPNGDDRRIGEPNYHNLWGAVHPLYLTPESMLRMGSDYSFRGQTYSDPYDFDAIRQNKPSQQLGVELLYIGYKRVEPQT